MGRPEGIGSDKTFYDTSAFAAIAPGQAPRFGSMGRNSLRNPGTLRHDLMLSKDLRFFERVTMTFRAEAYNFTNSRLSNSFASNDVTNPNVLRVLSAVDERQTRRGPHPCSVPDRGNAGRNVGRKTIGSVPSRHPVLVIDVGPKQTAAGRDPGRALTNGETVHTRAVQRSGRRPVEPPPTLQIDRRKRESASLIRRADPAAPHAVGCERQCADTGLEQPEWNVLGSVEGRIDTQKSVAARA